MVLARIPKCGGGFHMRLLLMFVSHAFKLDLRFSRKCEKVKISSDMPLLEFILKA